MRRRDQRGQTTTEFVMIAGLITACAIALLGFMYPSLRQSLVRAAECVMGDVCDSGGAGIPGASESVPEVGHGIGMPLVDPRGGSGGHGATKPGDLLLPRACPLGPFSKTCSDNSDWQETKCLARAGFSGDWRDYVPPPLGHSLFGLPGGIADNAYAAYQNCKAERKKKDCECGKCDECDGEVSWEAGSRIACVHNDTDGGPSDLLESEAMIHDTTRMISGEPPLITENAAINSMKSQIVLALTEVPSGQSVELMGFSQGSAVLANALWQLRREGKITSDDWKRLHVVVMGAAEQRFPPELSQIDSYVSRQDVVADIGSTRELLNTGKIATPLPHEVKSGNDLGIPVDDCGDSRWKGCHDATRYIDYHAALETRLGNDLPGRTVMVNGINTPYENWNGVYQDDAGDQRLGGCKLYSKERYGSPS